MAVPGEIPHATKVTGGRLQPEPHVKEAWHARALHDLIDRHHLPAGSRQREGTTFWREGPRQRRDPLPVDPRFHVNREPVWHLRRPRGGHSGCVAVVDLAEMIRKKLLVGVTYLGANNLPQHSIEFAGIVTAVDPLVTIESGGGDPFTLPPEPDAFNRAQPGEYRLRSDGTIVVDPDFITTWTVKPPSQRE